MKVLGIILLVLLLLALLPFTLRVRYDEAGVLAYLKIWFVRLRLAPKKAKKKQKKKKPKKEKKPKEPPAEGEGEAPKKKGGKLDAVRAALPLIKPAVSGVKKRLTIKNLDLYVTWAAADPYGAAVGYGYAQAALGMLWAIADQNFKVKKSSLGCGVDFEENSPTVFADAAVSIRLGQVVTLGVPLLVKFLCNNSKLKKRKAENNRKEA